MFLNLPHIITKVMQRHFSLNISLRTARIFNIMLKKINSCSLNCMHLPWQVPDFFSGTLYHFFLFQVSTYTSKTSKRTSCLQSLRKTGRVRKFGLHFAKTPGITTDVKIYIKLLLQISPMKLFLLLRLTNLTKDIRKY